MAAPVFVSYSHKDKDWLDRCLPFLRPLHREGTIDLWDDNRIRAGDEWRKEIEPALKRAQVAVVLVSQNFIDSDFICKHELPPLLDAARNRGLTILWLALGHCTHENTRIAEYQAVNEPSRPLNSLAEHEVDLVLKRLNQRIRQVTNVQVPTTSEGKPLFLVPYERNLAFTGREDVLAQLDRALLQGAGALSQTAAISGLGGVGKTQTAVEYVYRHRDQYTAVLWVVAESDQTLATGYAEIARKLNLPAAEEQNQAKVRDAVKAWLEDHQGWLLVVDNADTPALVKDYLPHQHQGSVFITSRAHSLQEIGIFHSLELNTLPPAEACAFLFKRIGRQQVSANEQNAATDLVAELGYLPLALEQAAAYIVETGASLANYLASYCKRHLKLLEIKKAFERKDSVATTWSLNFAEVEKTPASADLLRLSAFLAPDAIPLDLLALGASKIEGPLADAFARASDDPLTLDELLAPLLRYSLIKRDPGSPNFSIHRLIQAVVRDQLTDEQQKLWAERAVTILNAAFPSAEFETWPTCDRLVAHTQAAAEWIGRWKLTLAAAARLLNQAGLYLWDRGQYDAGEPIMRQAVASFEQGVGLNHPDTATGLNNLGLLLVAKGHPDAETLHRRALAIREQALGPNHPDVAQSLNNLAALLHSKTDFDAAELLHRRALAIREQELGADHPSTARSINNLASVLHDKGDLLAAEPLYRRALIIWEEKLGPNHPDTATSLNNLAMLIDGKGDLAAAEPLYRRALAIREAALGPNHPRTVLTRNKLDALLTELQRQRVNDLLNSAFDTSPHQSIPNPKSPR